MDDADFWHRFVDGANWDSIPIEVFQWIANQSNCDKATALMLFWKGTPEYFVTMQDRREVPDINLDLYDLVTTIRRNWEAGHYIRAQIEFDLAEQTWPRDFSKLDREFGDLSLKLMPLDMRQPLQGRQVFTFETYEGIPSKLERQMHSGGKGKK